MWLAKVKGAASITLSNKPYDVAAASKMNTIAGRFEYAAKALLG